MDRELIKEMLELNNRSDDKKGKLYFESTFAEDFESDLYAAIDLVTKKIEQQIRKRHNKYKARKHTDAARTKRRRQETGI